MKGESERGREGKNLVGRRLEISARCRINSSPFIRSPPPLPPTSPRRRQDTANTRRLRRKSTNTDYPVRIRFPLLYPSPLTLRPPPISLCSQKSLVPFPPAAALLPKLFSLNPFVSLVSHIAVVPVSPPSSLALRCLVLWPSPDPSSTLSL